MNPLRSGLDTVKLSINGKLSHRQPWEIVLITSTTVLTVRWLWDFIYKDESIYGRLQKFVFNMAKKIPAVRRKVESELEAMRTSFNNSNLNRYKGAPFIVELPSGSKSPDEVLKIFYANMKLGEYDWKNGFVSGTVYCKDNEDIMNTLTEISRVSSYTNPLHIDVFPGVCKMEAEVIKICTKLFHGGPNACGSVTSGGTESILMACKAYRDYGAAVHNISEPQMVVPATAHPAFDKAAAYFKIRIKHVRYDPVTTTVDLRAMEKAITSNTCMLVASAPNYPYGTCDDVVAIAKLGLKYNIPVHVDCCLGGFLTAFMPAAGYTIQPFDFAVPGVTSLSADTHKYGFAPKGSSVVLYSNPKYHKHQFCVATEWPGGVYGSPSVCGSRSGGTIASCWAVMMLYGFDGYVKSTTRIIETSRYIERELRKIDEIFIFGKPMTSIVAFGSNSFHIYSLSEGLIEKGWNLNPLQFPVGIHLCVTDMHTKEGIADRFITDVKESVKEIMKNPPTKPMGKMAVYGMAQSIPDRSIVDDVTRLFITSMYYTPELPQEQK
uniref:sphinganine-1-phosphate aldolase n=1 Tax=Laodelphax striatellus TaxID=195883 RepID=A0A1C9HJJ0_LAOST|nr:sphingosine 1 phosphate lyase [Laodelphax striatellus]